MSDTVVNVIVVICGILLVLSMGMVCAAVDYQINYDEYHSKRKAKASKNKVKLEQKKLRKERPTTF